MPSTDFFTCAPRLRPQAVRRFSRLETAERAAEMFPHLTLSPTSPVSNTSENCKTRTTSIETLIECQGAHLSATDDGVETVCGKRSLNPFRALHTLLPEQKHKHTRSHTRPTLVIKFDRAPSRRAERGCLGSSERMPQSMVAHVARAAPLSLSFYLVKSCSADESRAQTEIKSSEIVAIISVGATRATTEGTAFGMPFVHLVPCLWQNACRRQRLIIFCC